MRPSNRTDEACKRRDEIQRRRSKKQGVKRKSNIAKKSGKRSRRIESPTTEAENNASQTQSRLGKKGRSGKGRKTQTYIIAIF